MKFTQILCILDIFEFTLLKQTVETGTSKHSKDLCEIVTSLVNHLVTWEVWNICSSLSLVHPPSLPTCHLYVNVYSVLGKLQSSIWQTLHRSLLLEPCLRGFLRIKYIGLFICDLESFTTHKEVKIWSRAFWRVHLYKLWKNKTGILVGLHIGYTGPRWPLSQDGTYQVFTEFNHEKLN